MRTGTREGAGRTGVGWVGIAVAVLAAAPAAPAAGQLRVSGDVSVETRGFFRAPLLVDQERHGASVSMQPELSWSWDGGDQVVTVEPFLRYDAADGERTHVDLRVASWERAWREWEVRVGLRTVFWGVTESQHLVDVINQTDAVENVDGEDKLGQPMVNLAAVRGWGTIDLFLLPGFRERTFPGADGRLRLPLVVDSDAVVFESAAGSRRLDWALRWSHYFGGFDVGLSWFQGTGREPRLVPQAGAGGTALVPHYDVIDQGGVDLQYTVGPWLWKAEGIRRSGGPRGAMWAATVGFERTSYQVFGSAADVGLLVEYLWDDRGAAATMPFEDDVFLGARLALNDVQSTTLLVGSIVDRDSGEGFYLVEGERRVGDAFTLALEARGVWGVEEGSLLGGFRRDDYLGITVAWWW